MGVIVFGATGGTGARIVERAHAEGRQVTVVARRPDAIRAAHPRLRVHRGDVLEPKTWAEVLEPGDVVLSALGVGSSRAPTRVYSDGAAAIVAAMRARGCRRLLAVTASTLVPTSEKTLPERLLLHPLIGVVYRELYADMRRMERELEASDLDWTVFRPPRLTDRPGTGRWRTAVGEALPRALQISRGDLAAAMLAAIADRSLIGRAVTVAA